MALGSVATCDIKHLLFAACDVWFLQVKLKMNYHGCVDTLQEECKRWFDKHARDGTNKTARAR